MILVTYDRSVELYSEPGIICHVVVESIPFATVAGRAVSKLVNVGPRTRIHSVDDITTALRVGSMLKYIFGWRGPEAEQWGNMSSNIQVLWCWPLTEPDT
jgi:hypothetical protein